MTHDGLVFGYHYEFPHPSRDDNPPCDTRKLERRSPEWYQCLFYDSRLLAKLERALLDELDVDLARVTNEKRQALGLGSGGPSETLLEVPGRGRNGEALQIASCSDIAWQASSPEAERIFAVLRRLWRAIGRTNQIAGDCPTIGSGHGLFQEMARKELAPGHFRRLPYFCWQKRRSTFDVESGTQAKVTFAGGL